MAYTTNEYMIIVTGNLPGGEVWSNDWCVLDVSETATIADAVSDVHSFYNTVAAIMSNNWTASAARTVRLATGVSLPAAFEAVTGAVDNTNVPTELAVRVSLDDQQGHRGGPFLCGFTRLALSDLGYFDSTQRTTVLGAVDSLANNLVSNGFQLRINRPTVLTTVPAAQARIGQVFDVIRRRRNALLEDYASANLL